MKKYVLFLFFAASCVYVNGQMRITEYMYDGPSKEFIEFTNVGAAAIDMTGWSFDDADRVAGAQSLTAFGIVQPGESVILAENTAAAFRTAWNLCSGIKIIGGLTNNLGRSDEINLYNASAALIDRLTYGDQTFAGTIRTQNISGWVNATGLGTNTIANWFLSTVADAENSFTSAASEIGSPGKSARATVSFNPCIVITGAPTIVINVAATTDLLDGGAASSPASPYAISGVINDPNDPAKTIGIDFTIGDDVTPVGSLTTTVATSNASVVPLANLVLTGTGASRNLKITPAAVGYSNITITVNDGTNSTSYILNYAASSASAGSSTWLTGIADASSAIAIDDNYMIVANDETNFLYVYSRNQPGLYAKRYDFNQSNIFALTDGSTNNWKEVDVEAGLKSIANTGRIYWVGSLSNGSNAPFEDKPNRNRIFAVTATGTGTATSFTDAGHYNGLRQQLISWGDSHGYNFTASTVAGKDPKLIDGFNVEGMVFGPDNTTLYVGFRAPLVPTGSRTKAVIAPVLNFEAWFNNGSPSGNPAIGSPIELNLGGRGIRELTRLSNGTYVIIAGSYGETSIPAVYTWSGIATEAALLQSSFDLTGINAEGVMQVNQAGLLSLNKLQIIADNGDNVYYNDGIAAKDLSSDNFRKFRSDIITSSLGNVLPVRLEYFTAAKRGADVLLSWKIAGSDDAVLFEIQRSANGRDFVAIQNISLNSSQSIYSFNDINVPSGKLYYRIATKNITGEKLLSAVRLINPSADATIVSVYPNPVTNNNFSLIVNKTGVKEVDIYNSAGILQKSLSFAQTAIDINTNGWTKGYYLLRIITDDATITLKKIAVQ